MSFLSHRPKVSVSMSFKPLTSLLIANRGEIAIRIARSAAELGIKTIAVFAEDDAASLHTVKCDQAVALQGVGVPAYLDGPGIVAAALEAGADAIHPGYGFLSENAAFARLCAQAGLVFVGPTPETLDLFGDKGQSRRLAERLDVSVLAGTNRPTSCEEARAFLAEQGPAGGIMIKAIAGGGGRGMRPVLVASELEQAYERCQSEAQMAFGSSDVYVEALFPRARHIEVQVIGDGTGAVSHVWERECSLQRQRQKIVEIAPAPNLAGDMRDRLLEAAVALARAVKLRSLATIEFLVDASGDQTSRGPRFAFIEANPRLQVEHTVTEEVTGLDLVAAQLEIAQGRTLPSIGLEQIWIPIPRGMALQARINMETMTADGGARPGGGTIQTFEPPTGPGLRVDAFGYAGYTTSPRYDSLLAKLIVHARSGRLPDVCAKAARALAEFRIAGVPTNAGFLQTVLKHDDVTAGQADTRWIDVHAARLIEETATLDRPRSFEVTSAQRRAGTRLESNDPLAVLAHGKAGGTATRAGNSNVTMAAVQAASGPEGTVPLVAPMQGTIIAITAQPGTAVTASSEVLIMEAMKMQHVITAGCSGIVRELAVAQGDTVYEGAALAFIEPGDVDLGTAAATIAVDPDHIRPDLQEILDRRALTLDAARPDAVQRRRVRNQRTARENIEDLCDDGSFFEYGGLAIAAQRSRRSLDDLVRRTPADGMVMGLGRVNGQYFADDKARCAVLAYDYTVLAGTQGTKNHEKKDRLLELVERYRLPLFVFAEGGGGRPGDIDTSFAASLHIKTFNMFPKLSGLVPLIGINSGYCFAGNAVLLGCCDVIIATANSSIGMGGPAMIEGGGLGVFRPDEVGPMSVQVPNGVVDIAVADEAEAVTAARMYMGYFQGAIPDWSCADQRRLRSMVPENRMRVYDVRQVLTTLADEESVLELRAKFGVGMITALARIEGRPVGIIANNPMHLGGAIDADAADKATRFMQLCDAYDLPMVFLCDTPGNMVGPEAERTALVRHACRLYNIAANMTVPLLTVILRKGYGLGAQGMAAGSFHAPLMTISWPTGEFGGMGLEGAVKLGYRTELSAVADPAARKALYDQKVAELYAQGKALNVATYFEIDEVIDPAETRRWIMAGLRSAPPVPARTGKKHAWIDTW
jgi:acetyl/propionyl-CoA carboxylase alpha subunit/acetyl-CoA carboxylase carboxyltransferase component